jgi:hypothetical protein
MKTQTQFKNASLVSVVNGTIVVKDSTGREHTFTNASIVSVNNGTIVIETEWKPKKGELIKLTGCNTNCYCIYRRCEENYIYDYGFKKIADSTLHTVIDNFSWCIVGVTVSPVTPEEQKEFDDFCKSQGKIWNKETLQWEKYKWEPKMGETYYFIDTLGEVSCTRNNTLNLDPTRIKYGNCFSTKEQAKEAAEKLKEFFKSL